MATGGLSAASAAVGRRPVGHLAQPALADPPFLLSMVPALTGQCPDPLCRTSGTMGRTEPCDVVVRRATARLA